MRFPARIQISVTEDHIKRGIPRRCGGCPIALAGSTDESTVRVQLATMNYTSYGSVAIYRLPYSAQIFILNFDKGLHVEPLNFEATLIEVFPSYTTNGE